LLLVATVLKMLGRLPAVDFDVLTVTLLTAAVCLTGLPSLPTAPLLLYGIYEAALIVWLFRSLSADAGEELRTATLLIVTVLVSASAVNGLRAVVSWTFFALAALGAAAILLPGIPAGAMEQFGESLRNAFGYTSSYSAVLGFICAAAALIARW